MLPARLLLSCDAAELVLYKPDRPRAHGAAGGEAGAPHSPPRSPSLEGSGAGQESKPAPKYAQHAWQAWADEAAPGSAQAGRLVLARSEHFAADIGLGRALSVRLRPRGVQLYLGGAQLALLCALLKSYSSYSDWWFRLFSAREGVVMPASELDSQRYTLAYVRKPQRQNAKGGKEVRELDVRLSADAALLCRFSARAGGWALPAGVSVLAKEGNVVCAPAASSGGALLGKEEAPARASGGGPAIPLSGGEVAGGEAALFPLGGEVPDAGEAGGEVGAGGGAEGEGEPGEVREGKECERSPGESGRSPVKSGNPVKSGRPQKSARRPRTSRRSSEDSASPGDFRVIPGDSSRNTGGSLEEEEEVPTTVASSTEPATTVGASSIGHPQHSAPTIASDGAVEPRPSPVQLAQLATPQAEQAAPPATTQAPPPPPVGLTSTESAQLALVEELMTGARLLCAFELELAPEGALTVCCVGPLHTHQTHAVGGGEGGGEGGGHHGLPPTPPLHSLRVRAGGALRGGMAPGASSHLQPAGAAVEIMADGWFLSFALKLGEFAKEDPWLTLKTGLVNGEVTAVGSGRQLVAGTSAGREGREERPLASLRIERGRALTKVRATASHVSLTLAPSAELRALLADLVAGVWEEDETQAMEVAAASAAADLLVAQAANDKRDLFARARAAELALSHTAASPLEGVLAAPSSNEGQDQTEVAASVLAAFQGAFVKRSHSPTGPSARPLPRWTTADGRAQQQQPPPNRRLLRGTSASGSASGSSSRFPTVATPPPTAAQIAAAKAAAALRPSAFLLGGAALDVRAQLSSAFVVMLAGGEGASRDERALVLRLESSVALRSNGRAELAKFRLSTSLSSARLAFGSARPLESQLSAATVAQYLVDPFEVKASFRASEGG
ncbi:hypothetical protein T492DRAFT_903752, partial [Pavlovales sp. CCMP2436]